MNRVRYYVSVPKNVAKAIKRYPAKDRVAIFHAIENLEGDPRPPGCAKLRVSDLGEYRTKVRGYRIRYDVDDLEKVVYILVVKSRGGAYR